MASTKVPLSAERLAKMRAQIPSGRGFFLFANGRLHEEYATAYKAEAVADAEEINAQHGHGVVVLSAKGAVVFRRISYKAKRRASKFRSVAASVAAKRSSRFGSR